MVYSPSEPRGPQYGPLGGKIRNGEGPPKYGAPVRRTPPPGISNRSSALVSACFRQVSKMFRLSLRTQYDKGALFIHRLLRSLGGEFRVMWRLI